MSYWVLYSSITRNVTRGKVITSAMIYSLLAICIFSAGAVSAEDSPSNAELFQMILDMKANQESLKQEADQARAEAAEAKRELAITREILKSTQESLMVTEEIVAQTQEGLAETQAELGTGPSSSVVKIPDKAGGWTAMAEVMFMRPSTGEFAYAISDDEVLGAKIVGVGRVLTVDTDYEPGFRIGASYDFAGSGVDTKLTYTYLRTSFSDSAAAPAGGRLLAILTNRGGGQDKEADTARAEFDFDFDVVDLEVGQTFQAGGSNVDIRLFGGLRYASIDQEMNARYAGIDFAGDAHDFTDIRSTVDLTAIGPRIGVGGSWDLGSGFSLFGHTAGSLLVADMDAFLSETRCADSPGGGCGDPDPRIELDQDFETRVVPVVEISLGAGWTRQYSSGLWTLRGGYEVQNWFNVVDPLRLTDANKDRPNQDASNTTDLALDGFFFNANLEF